MPVLHFERRMYHTDGYGDRSTERTPACGSSAETIKYTRAKVNVTCKKCRKKLGLEDVEPMAVVSKQTNGRPTAWDRLDAEAMDDGQPIPPLPEEPAAVVPLPDPVVESRVEPPPTVSPVPRTTPRERARHRVALVFFHLMRSHMGAEVVAQLAEMCSRGVTGSGREYEGDLMPRAERLADLVLTPDYERRIAADPMLATTVNRPHRPDEA